MILLLAVAATGASLLPLVFMWSASLMTSTEALARPPRIVPTDPQWSNYVDVFAQVPFLRYMVNSLVVAGGVTLGSLVLHSMAGYAFARVRFPGRDLMFLLILSTMMIPFAMIMVPLFVIIRELGWVNTFPGLIVPLIPSAYGIFLFRQFYLSLPAELEEAAVVDGANHFQVYRRIAVPLSRPIFAALGALYFILNWNNLLWPLIVAQTRDMWLIQVGIQSFAGQRATQWNLVMAASAIALIPTLLVFFLLQRRLVEGVKMSGIRG